MTVAAEKSFTPPKTMRIAMNEAIQMAEFFGAFPHEVGGLNRMIYVNAVQENDNPPEWLRGRRHSCALPRYLTGVSGHRFSITNLSLPEIGRRVAWIVENQHGPWRIDVAAIIISDDTDAVHYRLRFA